MWATFGVCGLKPIECTRPVGVQVILTALGKDVLVLSIVGHSVDNKACR